MSKTEPVPDVEQVEQVEQVERVITRPRATAGIETLVEWLEALATRARRSWLDRQRRVPLGPRR